MRSSHARRHLRRSLTAFTAATATMLGASGVAVLAAAPAHAAELGPGDCTVSFSADHLYDGEPALTMHSELGSDYFETGVVLTTVADGARVVTRGFGGGVDGLAVDRTIALAWAGSNAVTLTVRLYPAGTPQNAPDINTPANCEATIRLKPVGPANLSFDPIADHRIGEGPVTVGTQTSSDATVTVTSQTPEVCTYADGKVTLEAVGACTLQAAQPANLGYDADSVTTTFQVLAPLATCTASSSRAIVLPGQSTTLTVHLADAARLPGAFVIDGHLGTGAGTHGDVIGPDLTWTLAYGDITAFGATSTFGLRVFAADVDPATADDDTPALCETTVTVGTDAVTITPIGAHRVGDAPFAVTATSDSGRAVTFSSLTPATCAVDADKVTVLAAGPCTVKAAVVEGSVEAVSATASFTVSPAVVVPPTPVQDPTTMRLTGPKGLPLSARSASVRFTSTSPAARHLTSLSPKVCSLSGTTVKLLRAGTCIVRATQDADATHAAPAPATIAFPVWATPAIPRTGRTTQVVKVLGRGESSLRVRASGGCVVHGGSVVLLRAGRCSVTVTKAGRTVRRGVVSVQFVKPTSHGFTTMRRAATVRFSFNSARLTPAGKRALKAAAPTLRKAAVITVYGHTDGPGRNSPASLRLSAKRAAAVATYLRSLRVKVRISTVGVAHHSPRGTSTAANRRAEVYYLR